jgi:hypothetical protein
MFEVSEDVSHSDSDSLLGSDETDEPERGSGHCPGPPGTGNAKGQGIPGIELCLYQFPSGPATIGEYAAAAATCALNSSHRTSASGLVLLPVSKASGNTSKPLRTGR